MVFCATEKGNSSTERGINHAHHARKVLLLVSVLKEKNYVELFFTPLIKLAE